MNATELFRADLGDINHPIERKLADFRDAISDIGLSKHGKDATLALMKTALKRTPYLSANNIVDLAKRISEMDGDPITINHFAEAMNYDVSRATDDPRRAFDIDIEDVMTVISDKGYIPEHKKRRYHLGIAAPGFESNLEKLMAIRTILHIKSHPKHDLNVTQLMKSFASNWGWQFRDADDELSEAISVQEFLTEIETILSHAPDIIEVAAALHAYINKLEEL